ncbi:MAG TPA: hypothetical protein VGV37_06095 [Aliidongia sp.]|uniref:hypothetical protein n=1 Tax=Aliidongia sp. TaxID=1914230 RepID=UPI002DDCEDFC|nr:hypothetical protein [Aliidongia sp.]HEV2674095.1 hypothetical protein [Aliidongia sp.]
MPDKNMTTSPTIAEFQYLAERVRKLEERDELSNVVVGKDGSVRPMTAEEIMSEHVTFFDAKFQVAAEDPPWKRAKVGDRVMVQRGSSRREERVVGVDDDSLSSRVMRCRTATKSSPNGRWVLNEDLLSILPPESSEHGVDNIVSGRPGFQVIREATDHHVHPREVHAILDALASAGILAGAKVRVTGEMIETAMDAYRLTFGNLRTAMKAALRTIPGLEVEE